MIRDESAFIAPPPPPPPLPPPSLPPPPQLSSTLVSVLVQDTLKNNVSIKDDLDFALQRLIDSSEKFKFVFYLNNVDLEPQIQDGPKCGLVALSIASAVEGKDSTRVDKIYEKALSLGYTKLGEIFKAEYLADLAEKCCGFPSKVIDGGLQAHFRCIIYNLLEKNLLLLPYDADRNHQPCCKKGFKAHWAVITGFVVLSEYDKKCLNEGFIHLNPTCPPLKFCDCKVNETHKEKKNSLRLYSFNNEIFLTKNESTSFESTKSKTKGKIYLIGLQGKSKHVGLWSFEEMAKSNDNLMFFSDERNLEEYIVPEGGPAEGLKGKIIILNCQNLRKNSNK